MHDMLLFDGRKKMTNIAIVDDDNNFLNIIKMKLLNLDNTLNVFSYKRPYDFIMDIDSIDYVLLDIDLPQIDGITLSKQLRKNDISIFFITSYKELMIKAFGKNVEGFIVKDNLDEGISDFIQFISNNRKENSINVHTLRQEVKLFFNDIIYVQYSLRDIEYHLINNKTILQKNTNLKDILCQLNEKFVLINRDIIINIDFVDDLKNEFVYIRKNKFKVSRRKIKNLRLKLIEREFYSEY